MSTIRAKGNNIQEIQRLAVSPVNRLENAAGVYFAIALTPNPAMKKVGAPRKSTLTGTSIP